MSVRLECTICHKIFSAPDISSPVPSHPREGFIDEPGYVPCLGSGTKGIPMGFN